MASIPSLVPTAQGVPSASVTWAKASADAAFVANQAIRALVDPPAACPGCLADAGEPWPDGTTSRFCSPCTARMARTRRHAHTSATPCAPDDTTKHAGHSQRDYYVAFETYDPASQGWLNDADVALAPDPVAAIEQVRRQQGVAAHAFRVLLLECDDEQVCLDRQTLDGITQRMRRSPAGYTFVEYSLLAESLGCRYVELEDTAQA